MANQIMKAIQVVACLTAATFSLNLKAQTASQYFPSEIGSSWVYNSYAGTNVSTTPVGTVVAVGYAEGTVNGVVPRLLTSGVGEYDGFTVSGDQVLYHGTSYRSTSTSGVSNITSMVFTPPIVFDKLSTVGTTWTGSGAVSGYVVGVGSFSGTYSASTSINGIETVTTPAGTFNALRVSYSRTVAVPGTSNWVRSYSFWLAKGVGIVKQQASGTTNGVVLSGSNLIKNVSLSQGWNLIGNPLERALTVADIFEGNSSVVTVWKWNASQSAWAFYTPSMTASALQTYASGKGYSVLDQISPTEGFWVNASAATSVLLH